MDISLFWDRIKNLCKKNGITQQELSERLGYGSRNLEIKIARNSLPNIDELKKLSKIFNVSFDYLIDGIDGAKEAVETEKGKFFVPILNQKVSAGNGSMLNDDEIVGYLAVPDSLKRYREKIAALHVDGDSMEPTLRRGDIVVCDACGYSG